MTIILRSPDSEPVDELDWMTDEDFEKIMLYYMSLPVKDNDERGN